MSKYARSARSPLFQAMLGFALVAVVLAGCAPAATQAPTTAPTVAATQPPAQTGMDKLIADAKAEGTLSTIALPHDWCNYGAVIDGFKAKYGLQVNELNPQGGSGDEIEAIKANKDNKGPQAPDVIDVGLSFGPSSKADGLIAPYKVSTWDTIPDSAKDPDGYWYGDYYGVLAFQVNSDQVKTAPADWADLQKADYKGQVALAGDPRVSNQAILSVYASSLASGGSLDDAKPGLDFWAKVNTAGNFVPVIADNGTFARGETPIIIQWDYLALAARDSLAGNPPVEVVVPKSGRLGGVYVQAISAYAPHPNAAKLWMEYLYSDEGQLIWLSPPGYCHPIRQADLEKNGKIPADLKAKLPDISGAVFPSLDQQNAAKKVITEGWDSIVGADVKKASP